MAAGDIIVHRGSVTFGASSDSATVTLSPAVGSLGSAAERICGVIRTGMGNGASGNFPDDISVSIELTDVDELTFTRESTGANVDVTAYWEVWEYVGAAAGANEFKVQRATGGITSGSQSGGMFSPGSITVEANTPVLVWDSYTHDATSHDGESMMFYTTSRCGGAGSTTFFALSFRGSLSGKVGTIDAKYVCIELTGSNWSLYQFNGDPEPEGSDVDIDVVNGSSVQLSSIDWTKAFICSAKLISAPTAGGGSPSYYQDDANDIGWTVRPGSDSSGVTVKAQVHSGVDDGDFHTIQGYVAVNSDSTFLTVEHIDSITGGESNLTASTTDDYTITDVSDLDYAAVIATAFTTNTATDYAHCGYNYHLTSTTNLRFERSQATGTGEFAAQIIKFEAPQPVIEPGLHSSSTTHHTLALATMPVLGLHSSSTTIHGLALPSAVAHRDTRYYASGTIATDLGQYATNITASGVGAYELTSARTNITGERNVYYRGDLSTADTNTVLVRHGDTTTVTTNTYGLAVGGSNTIQVLYGSTALIDLAVGMSGTDQDYSIGWSTRANPDTTGASDAQISMLWVYNHDTGDRYIAHAAHAEPTGSAAYAFSVAGWWNGAGMTGSPTNAPSDVRVGTTFYSSVQYEDDFVSATPYSTAYAREVQRFPITKASGLGSDGQWYGPAAQYAAHHVGVSARRTASPLVNEIYRDAETISWDGSGLYEPENQWIYAPGQTTYQLCATYLRWIRVPLTYSRVRVRVNVTSYPTTGADVPIGLACYSMERPPPWPTAWERTVPVVGTYAHSTRADREWVDLGELEIVRLLVPDDPALHHTTHLCLALAIDPEGTASNDTDARVVIHGWQVTPAGPPSADYAGPETPPNQQLQPLPLGGLSPFQMLQQG